MADAEDRIWLAASGEMVLACAGEWKARLAAMFEDGRPAGVDAADVTEIDLPMLQLLLSARRTFAARGTPLAFRDPAGIVDYACRRAGIEIGEACP